MLALIKVEVLVTVDEDERVRIGNVRNIVVRANESMCYLASNQTPPYFTVTQCPSVSQLDFIRDFFKK